MFIVYVLAVLSTYSMYTRFRPPSIVLKFPQFSRTRKIGTHMKDTSTHMSGMKIAIFFVRIENAYDDKNNIFSSKIVSYFIADCFIYNTICPLPLPL